MLWARFREICGDQIDQRGDRRLRIVARCLYLDSAAVRRAHRHDLGHALGVDPVGGVGDADRNLGLELLGELGELDRGASMHADGVHELHVAGHDLPVSLRSFQHVHFPSFLLPTLQPAESSSATALTSSSELPPAASVAAMTAPSTIGALQTTTRFRRSGSSISTAISLLVSAPPRSTRIATPFADQAS